MVQPCRCVSPWGPENPVGDRDGEKSALRPGTGAGSSQPRGWGGGAGLFEVSGDGVALSVGDGPVAIPTCKMCSRCGRRFGFENYYGCRRYCKRLMKEIN